MKKYSIIMMMFIAMLFMFSAPAFADTTSQADSASTSTLTNTNINNNNNTGSPTATAEAITKSTASTGPVNVDVDVTTPAQPAATERGSNHSVVENRGTGYRGFPNPGETNYPGQPGYFGPVLKKSALFMKLKEMLQFQDNFTAEEIEIMTKDGDVDVLPTMKCEKVDKENQSASIDVLSTKPDRKMKLKGWVLVRADDVDTPSPKVMAHAAAFAKEYGADAIVLNAEGIELILKSFGWGVGFNTTIATIASGEMSGSVSSGGFGVSGGKAGYKGLPWIQFFVVSYE